jgi:hypothetical protein
MGQLVLPTRNDKGNSRYPKANYANLNAVSNVIHYITRTRYRENRMNELLGYGADGVAVNADVDSIINQFLYVQDVFNINKRGGRRMHHEVYNLYDYEARELMFYPENLWLFGKDCCRVYYEMGFQTVFAVHFQQGKHFHIHFAINSISYIDGRKWHTSLEELKIRNQIFDQILMQHQIRVQGYYKIPQLAKDRTIDDLMMISHK